MIIVAAGDCGVDRYVSLGFDRPGGITLNFAASARRFFARTDRIAVVTAVGTDPESAMVREALDRLGIEARLTVREGATSIQYIDLAPSGEKIFLRYDQGVLGDFRIGSGERELLRDCDLMVTTVYEQIQGFFDSVMEAPSRGLRVVDFGPLTDFGGDVGFVARYADRFHIGFFGLERSETALIAELEALARRERKLFVVTLGPEGSVVLGLGERLSAPAVPVPRVVDTTGAGDTFSAAFLSEYCRSKDVVRSLRLGSEKAAEAVQRIGAFPLD